MSQLSPNFRQDINGLRAVAVLAVTLYHLAHFFSPENNLFKGGFLGVDIFFVISGFLMTKIIIEGLDRGNFSLYRFYKKRAKRICPALFVTVLLSIVIALLVLDTEYFRQTCRDGLRALGFVSNFWFARKVGYFDAESSERILLHTWSLSVEWQFYLIYPLIILFVSKLFSRKTLGLIVFILMLISLVYGCVYTLYSPMKSYYMLPSRAYELLIGSLAYFYPISFFIKRFKSKKVECLGDNNTKSSSLVEIIGLLCILVSLIVIDSAEGWPNPWSILPLLGTYLCIAADNKRTLLKGLIFQKLGLWSYAIYLVHWPLIVLIGAFSKDLDSKELFKNKLINCLWF